MSKTFISYAWENESHKNWVREFAARLRKDGIETILDQWHLVPGDQLTEFMECSIREIDFVLIICTPNYKMKSNRRTGGVGYEGDIMTAEVFNLGNQRKFIPILREGNWSDAAPSWLLGKYYIDLSEINYSEENYNELLATLHKLRLQAPPVGKVPTEPENENNINSVKNKCKQVEEGKLPVESLLGFNKHHYWLARKYAIEQIIRTNAPNTMDYLFEFRNVSYFLSQGYIRDYIELELQEGRLSSLKLEKAIKIVEELCLAPKVSKPCKEKNQKLLLKLREYLLTP